MWSIKAKSETYVICHERVTSLSFRYFRPRGIELRPIVYFKVLHTTEQYCPSGAITRKVNRVLKPNFKHMSHAIKE